MARVSYVTRPRTLPVRKQIQIGAGSALCAILILLITSAPWWSLPVISVAVAMTALWVGGAWERAEQTVAFAHAEIEVANAARLMADPQGIPLYATRDVAWTYMENALTMATEQVERRGNSAIHTALRGSGRLRLPSLPPEQVTAINDQLRKMGELDVQITAYLRAGNDATELHREAKAIWVTIARTVGQARTGLDLEAMKDHPELNRVFKAITDCQRSHMDVHPLAAVFTGRDGKRRIGRSCRFCPSVWSELV